MSKLISYSDAIREGQAELLKSDDRVILLGLGVPGPTGVFGTSIGLEQEFGSERVLDMPAAENGMTGIAVGMALLGMRPILVHQRLDFAILSLEQIVNQAAKWRYMYGNQASAPLTIRMIVGRGWGQGPQHSQSLHAWFGHVPGLQVVMPTTASDAKGMLIASVRSENPTVVIEHRWLYDILGEVPDGIYERPIGKAHIRRRGQDVTLVGVSYMVLECLAAADKLEQVGISAEVIDLASILPIDRETILDSVARTRRLLVADTSHVDFGIGSEIVSSVCAEYGKDLLANPRRVGLPFAPAPTTPSLANLYYPTARELVMEVCRILKVDDTGVEWPDQTAPLDVPNRDFIGPY